MNWKIATASARGSAHQRTGLPNQDAAEYAFLPEGKSESAIVAISDGHGGEKHFRSQVGSTLAVHSAINVMQEAFGSAFTLGTGEERGLNIEGLNRRLVERWINAVQGDLARNPITEIELKKLAELEDAIARQSIEENPQLAYGCTLLVAVATQTFVWCLQLGDGDILAVDKSGRTSRPLRADDRLVANQTTSICQPNAWAEIRTAVIEAPATLPSLLLLSTDGYVNSFRTENDFLQIGQDYLAIVREQGIDTLSQELPKILAEASQHGSGDDITLAILQGDVARPSASEESAEVVGASTAVSKTPHNLPENSKSVLYEQLRAKHSAQQREIQKLSNDVAETKRNMRRLRIFSTVLIVAALALFGYFHFQPKKIKTQESVPGAAAPGDDPKLPPALASGDGPLAKGNAAVPSTDWVLAVDGEPEIHLGKNTKLILVKDKLSIPLDLSEKKQDDYAEVQETKGGLKLVNHSKDAWEASSDGDATSDKKIKKDQGLLLVEGITVKFRKGLEGKITLTKTGT